MTRLRSTLTAVLLTALTAGLIGLAAPPASAAWRTVTTVHDARLQACKGTQAGRPTIKFRLDNRRARHQHRGGLFRTAGGSRTFEVRPAAGRVSGVRTVVVRPGDRFETFVGEIDGPIAGGGLSRGELPRC